MIFWNASMKLSHLRTFVAIADNSGFGRAASQLNLTQSAASRQLSALEAELGVSLFDRNGRNVKLTFEGEDLLRRSRRLLADANSLGERARALRGGLVGTLRISAAPQAIENVVAPFLADFQRRHPGVEIELVESATGRHGQLERGDIHLAIMPSFEAQNFQRRLLYPNYLLAVVAKTHRLGRRGMVDLTELADEPLLLLKQWFGARARFDAACNAAEIHPRVLLESGAPTTLVALAAVGYGVALIPSNIQMLQTEVRSVLLAHRKVPIGWWSSVAWNQNRFLPPYAGEFVGELVAHLRHAYPGRDLTRRAPQLPRPKE